MRPQTIMLIVLADLGLIAAGLAYADTQGWLGVSETINPEVLRVRYLPVDAESGRTVTDVRVNCFMKGNNDACTLNRDDRREEVAINLGIQRQERRGLWSSLSSEVLGGADLEVNLMFIHPNYPRLVRTYRLNELVALAAERQRIELPPAAVTTAPEGLDAAPETATAPEAAPAAEPQP